MIKEFADTSQSRINVSLSEMFRIFCKKAVKQNDKKLVMHDDGSVLDVFDDGLLSGTEH